MKKSKMPAMVITGRESLECQVVEHKQRQLEVKALVASMEAEKAAIEKRYQERLAPLLQEIEQAEIAIQFYSEAHRAELLVDRKSLEVMGSEIGFEFTPWRVELRSGIKNEKVVVKRAQTIVEQLEAAKQDDWASKYLRQPDPVVAKAVLLSDRELLSPERQALLGVIFERDEQFFIRHKSDLVEGATCLTPAAAAA